MEYAVIFVLVCIGIAIAWPFIFLVQFGIISALMLAGALVLDGLSAVGRMLFGKKRR